VERHEEPARHANDAKARAITKQGCLSLVLCLLYLLCVTEIAVAILTTGGRWFALLAPFMAAGGHRQFKTLHGKVAFYVCVVLVWGVIAVIALVKASR
jgi:hypothetical protein